MVSDVYGFTALGEVVCEGTGRTKVVVPVLFSRSLVVLDDRVE